MTSRDRRALALEMTLMGQYRRLERMKCIAMQHEKHERWAAITEALRARLAERGVRT